MLNSWLNGNGMKLQKIAMSKFSDPSLSYGNISTSNDLIEVFDGGILRHYCHVPSIKHFDDIFRFVSIKFKQNMDLKQKCFLWIKLIFNFRYDPLKKDQ